MATKKFSSELNSRGTVKITDKLMIQNIDTGVVEYTTVQELLAALAIYGNVGIGTTAPGKKLQVGDGTAGVERIRIYGNATAVLDLNVAVDDAASRNWSLVTNIDDYGDFAISQSTAKWGDGYGGTQRLHIKPNGNVGIGTIIPTSRLHVVGLPEYNDNANAAASGLTAGAFYRTGDLLKICH